MREIEFIGAEAFEKKLSRLPKKISRGIVRQVLREGSNTIKAATKANAPVGEGRIRTRITKGSGSQDHAPGYMKKSIVTRAGKRNRPGTYAFLQYFDTGRFPDLISQSTRAHTTSTKGKRFKTARRRRYFYPAAVEYGHAKAPPHAFIQPAFNAVKGRVKQRALRRLASGIERAARSV